MTMTTPHARVLKRQVISEKSSFLSNTGTYAFVVDPRATKGDVRKAIEAVFQVKVASVRTISLPSKHIQRGKQRGRRPGYKKALVTLAEGNTIDVA